MLRIKVSINIIYIRVSILVINMLIDLDLATERGSEFQAYSKRIPCILIINRYTNCHTILYIINILNNIYIYIYIYYTSMYLLFQSFTKSNIHLRYLHIVSLTVFYFYIYIYKFSDSQMKKNKDRKQNK